MYIYRTGAVGAKNQLIERPVEECACFIVNSEEIIYAVCAALNVPEYERNYLAERVGAYKSQVFSVYKTNGQWRIAYMTDELGADWEVRIQTSFQGGNDGGEAGQVSQEGEINTE